jgi:hypothetical protein
MAAQMGHRDRRGVFNLVLVSCLCCTLHTAVAAASGMQLRAAVQLQRLRALRCVPAAESMSMLCSASVLASVPPQRIYTDNVRFCSQPTHRQASHTAAAMTTHVGTPRTNSWGPATTPAASAQVRDTSHLSQVQHLTTSHMLAEGCDAAQHSSVELALQSLGYTLQQPLSK